MGIVSKDDYLKAAQLFHWAKREHYQMWFTGSLERNRRTEVMLPRLVKKGKLVGIVTDRDLKEASASDATTLEIHELLYLLSKIKVIEIMTKTPITMPPDYTIEEAAQILLEKRDLRIKDQNGHGSYLTILAP